MAPMDPLLHTKSVSNNKRRREAVPHPDEIYKASKLNGDNGPRPEGAGASGTVVDDEDLEAGPAMPPEELDEPVDDEGRFFGGGLTGSATQALDYLDQRDQDEVVTAEKIDAAWLRKQALNFEKKISKNAELRAKYDGQPQKFVSSEADLDAEIKALSLLSEHPNLYTEFVRLGSVASLVSLLAHENSDIAIDAIEIIGELIDEDVNATDEDWTVLVDAMLDADLLNLLHQNLTRLDEVADADRSGLYHILNTLEALASKAAVLQQITKHDSFLPWLLTRALREEPRVTQNKQYAAEILAILLQSSQEARSAFCSRNGVDLVLQALSPYRRKDPDRGTEEEEFVENLFDGLACVLDESEGKTRFLEAQGIELCLLMLRDGKMSRPRALRLLDHSVGGLDGLASCEAIVEAAGLKPLFRLFMKKQDTESTANLVGILATMLRLLPAESAARIRLLGKFVEKDYEKVTRLLQLRAESSHRLAAVDAEIARERAALDADDVEDMADTWLSRRFEAGLATLQSICQIIAWLVAEDAGAQQKVKTLLADRNASLDDIKRILQDHADQPFAEGELSAMTKDMLVTLDIRTHRLMDEDLIERYMHP